MKASQNSSYFNTTNESGEALKQSQVKAETQDQKVLKFFRDHPDAEYTPASIHYYVGGKSPITSTRRAMSNLTKGGLLEKTKYKEQGYYGKPNYMWRLKKEVGQIEMFNQQSIGI